MGTDVTNKNLLNSYHFNLLTKHHCFQNLSLFGLEETLKKCLNINILVQFTIVSIFMEYSTKIVIKIMHISYVWFLHGTEYSVEWIIYKPRVYTDDVIVTNLNRKVSFTERPRNISFGLDISFSHIAWEARRHRRTITTRRAKPQIHKRVAVYATDIPGCSAKGCVIVEAWAGS